MTQLFVILDFDCIGVNVENTSENIFEYPGS